MVRPAELERAQRGAVELGDYHSVYQLARITKFPVVWGGAGGRSICVDLAVSDAGSRCNMTFQFCVGAGRQFSISKTASAVYPRVRLK